MRKNLVAFAIFVAALAALSQVTPMLGVVDDAWITYAYARNLAHGNGIVFNPGERVEGCTAFLHMVILAPFSWLTERLDRVAVALNVLAWAAVVTLLWSFIRNASGPRVGVLGLLMTGFALLGFSGAAWTFSGMEMPLVALAWIAAVWAHLRERETGAIPWSSALLTVAAGLLRPDGILVAPTLAISALWRGRARRPNHPASQPPSLSASGAQWRAAAIYCGLVLALFGGYWLWRWSYFGYPLPNTFYAKVTSTSLSLTLTGVMYLLRWMFGMVVPLFGLIALIAARRERPAPRWVRLMLALTATSIGYCLLVGGDFFSFHRYLLPSYAPMLLVTWWYGTGLLQKLRRGKPQRVRSRAGRIVWAVACFLICQAIYFVGRLPPQGLVQEFIVMNTRDWALVADKLSSVTPPAARIATVPIGAMGYFSHRYILDLVGLTDVHIAHAEAPTGVGITGHEKYDIDYVMERRPELIAAWPAVMPPGVEGLQKWISSNIATEAQRKLMIDPRTRREYRFVWLLLDKSVPIRRGGIERWQDLQRGYWAGMENAKGVIALLRSDLVGDPAWSAFTPMADRDADWLWCVMASHDNAEIYDKFRAMSAGKPPPCGAAARTAPALGADVDAIVDRLAGK